jgi:hypothetical protein
LQIDQDSFCLSSLLAAEEEVAVGLFGLRLEGSKVVFAAVVVFVSDF